MENKRRLSEIAQKGYKNTKMWYLTCKAYVEELSMKLESSKKMDDGNAQWLEAQLKKAYVNLEEAEQKLNEWRYLSSEEIEDLMDEPYGEEER